MKALKNESALFTSRVTGTISDCYAGSLEPADAQLMALYTLIGKCICEQGEKAYVVHLAQTLAEQFPKIKGFSPRNLRRMRDFYRAYESSPALMRQAQSLNWTQNTVILECCETDEQRAFYTNLAAEQNLSKLALMKAIESGAFEAAPDDNVSAQNVAAACGPVSDCTEEEAVDTTSGDKAACGAVVTACEPPRQGNSAPGRMKAGAAISTDEVFGKTVKGRKIRHIKIEQKKSLSTVWYKPLELLSNRLKIDKELCQQPLGTATA